MKGNYDYIIKKLGKPLYYDVYGAPHYQLRHWAVSTQEDFDEFMKYMRITICQACGESFRVQCTHPVYQGHGDCTEHYGDPPIHDRDEDRNCVGNTMNVDETRAFTVEETLQFLKKALYFEPDEHDMKRINKLIKKYEKLTA